MAKRKKKKRTKRLARQYSRQARKSAPKIPPFSKVLPFHKAVRRLLPTFKEAAASQVNPEAVRQYQEAERQLMNRLATSGGRFARSFGQVGALQANAERQRKAQIHDFLYGPSGYVTGFKKLWYNPTRKAWTRSQTQGKRMKKPKVPGFKKFARQYRRQYGEKLQKPAAGENPLASPFIPEAPGWGGRFDRDPYYASPYTKSTGYWINPGTIV